MKNPELQNPPVVSRDHRILAALKFLTVDVIAIGALPEDSDELNKLREQIETKIVTGFWQSTRFSSEEEAVLKRGDFSSPAICEKLDAYLFVIAQEYGIRLLLSTLVLQRLLSWQCGENDGVRKLKTLFNEIVRSAKIERSGAKGRINSRHKSAKSEFVREITALQMRLREAFPETPSEVRDFVDTTIEEMPALFPMLRSNKASLLRFLNEDSRATAFRGPQDASFEKIKGDLTPTRFCEQWFAASTNRDPESVRQSISGSL